MSHFTVLVVGDDVEKALAPFHEFECTGLVNEFVQSIDITTEARAAYQDDTDARNFLKFLEVYYGIESTVAPGAAPDLEGAHKWGWAEVNEQGEVAKVIDRTNRNAKWDWYVLGGRWVGFFKVATGTPESEFQLGRAGLFAPKASERTADRIRWKDVDNSDGLDQYRTYAVVKDGVWMGKGDMGWFGFSANEKPDWDTENLKLLESLKPDDIVNLIDCHI